MSGQISELVNIAQIKAHAAITITTTGAAVSGGSIAPRDAVAVVDVSAAGGDADETMGLVIEGRNGADAFASAHRSDEPASMPFTQPNVPQFARIGLKPFKDYRYVATLAGTSPSFTFGVHLAIRARKRPVTKQLAT